MDRRALRYGPGSRTRTRLAPWRVPRARPPVVGGCLSWSAGRRETGDRRCPGSPCSGVWSIAPVSALAAPRSTGVPKVVVIVGPAGAATDRYRAEAARLRHRSLASTRRTSPRSTRRTRPGRRSRTRSRARASSSTWATATAGRARYRDASTHRPRTASGSTRPPAAATTRISTSARRRSRRASSSHRTRSSC